MRFTYLKYHKFNVELFTKKFFHVKDLLPADGFIDTYQTFKWV